MSIRLNALPEHLMLDVLHNLPPADQTPCSAVSHCFCQAATSQLLWFRMYCTLYRGNFTPPPTFQDLVAGTLTELDIERFPWRALVKWRTPAIMAAPVTTRLRGGEMIVEEAPLDRRGMLDIENVARRANLFSGSCQSMVLQQALRPLPLPRAVAYVELLVHGGASVGLVDRQDYSSHAHIGWHRESLGYHGDSGEIYLSQGSGMKFGPPFGLDPELVVENDATRAPRRADVVGVGIDFGIAAVSIAKSASTADFTYESDDVSVFFTKNGELVGSLPLISNNLKYFAFALHRRGDRASLNVGTARFYFDIETYSQSEKQPLTHGLVQRDSRGPPTPFESSSDSE